MTGSTRLFWSRFGIGLLGLAFALCVVVLMNPTSKFSRDLAEAQALLQDHHLILFTFDHPHKNYRRPESVDTPPLLSLPRDKWPEHGLDAVERGLSWGQCKSCGFPVTTEDVQNGFGGSVGAAARGYYWEEFSCYRHTYKTNIKIVPHTLFGTRERVFIRD